MATVTRVTATTTKRVQCWHWCESCGEKVFVSRAQSWRKAQPRCMKCGSPYLVTDKPANAKE